MRKTEIQEPDKNCRTLPPLGEHVVVHCAKFSCLGYRDSNGTWKNAFTHQILPEVVDFSPIG